MPEIEIFKAGTHRPMRGQPITFSADDIAGVAAAYDAAAHEAPIVVGHPATDAPAYGWVKSLAVRDGALVADVDDLDPEFAELVTAGRYKKVSASFYLPGAPGNPTPGRMQLRHVGFLGAQPPAVKGLKPISFAAAEDGVVSFGGDDTGLAEQARNLVARLADLIFAEQADSSTRSASGPPADTDPATAASRTDTRTEEPDMAKDPTEQPSPEDAANLAAERAALIAAQEKLARERAAFAEAQARRRHDENAALLDGLIDAGRFAPGMREQVIAFMDGLDHEGTVEFAEGTAAQTPLEFFRELIGKSGKLIAFGEVAAAAGDQPDIAADPDQLHGWDRARKAAKGEY